MAGLRCTEMVSVGLGSMVATLLRTREHGGSMTSTVGLGARWIDDGGGEPGSAVGCPIEAQRSDANPKSRAHPKSRFKTMHCLLVFGLVSKAFKKAFKY
ncbi:hypothetical protein E2562_038235 [Oryza meyeriana var. granulata]|uniref:Uncharacterized protein n=1 Tax=Oryza meyeriana var. granulata TaxID=110450 RepID=A0A6G1E8Y7_9ORYZ|nr:hypothetical protein E2562_038235 [Oryza meyeriana var. granulata]